MLAWDRLPACPFLHDLDSEILMVTEHFLLKADRLEAYPTSTAHGSHRGRTVANETLFSGISSNESPKLTRADESP
jgi:hypothetical protein